MTKITAMLRTAEEITGQAECVSFSGCGWGYSDSMDRLARKGERLELTKLLDDSQYEYVSDSKNESYFWKACWLRNIEEKKERTWKVGDCIVVKSDIPLTHPEECYRFRIIQSEPERCFLLEEGTWNRWRDSIAIKDMNMITEEEMEKMLGGRLNLIN